MCTTRVSNVGYVKEMSNRLLISRTFTSLFCFVLLMVAKKQKYSNSIVLLQNKDEEMQKRKKKIYRDFLISYQQHTQILRGNKTSSFKRLCIL